MILPHIGFGGAEGEDGRGGADTAHCPRVAVERLHNFYRRAFQAVELPRDDAETVARVLIAAAVRRITSLGARLRFAIAAAAKASG